MGGLILDDGQIDFHRGNFDDARLSVCGGSDSADNGIRCSIVTGGELDVRVVLWMLCWCWIWESEFW